MPKLILDIPDLSKAEEFLAHFVPNLAFIEHAEIVAELPEKNGESEEVPPYYDPDKADYSVEDIRAIVAHFPEDKKWTFSDLQKYFPQDLKIKVEIINNQIFVMVTPSVFHQRISNRLSSKMTIYVEDNDLGEILVAPMDTKFDEDNNVQPDILFIAVTRYEIMGKNYIDGAPDMVVEIWSPGNTAKDKAHKHDLYEGKGVTEYWQIEPKAQTVLVETLNEAGKYETFSEGKTEGVVKSKVLEGFEVELSQLFKQ